MPGTVAATLGACLDGQHLTYRKTGTTRCPTKWPGGIFGARNSAGSPGYRDCPAPFCLAIQGSHIAQQSLFSKSNFDPAIG